MGMCKGCGEIFSAIEMENGYCKFCKDASAKDSSTKELKIESSHLSSKDSFNTNQKVIITDINMPFLSMVSFMIKWSIASIPAFIILFILGSALGGIIRAMFTS